MKNKWLECTLGFFLALCQPGLLYAQDMSESAAVPTREDTLLLTEMASGTQFEMLGMRNKQNLEFTLRSDQIVKSAALNLIFTPSPALLPQLSHLRVYLNDELAGIVDMDNAANGEQLTRSVELDPLMMTTFNRVRLEFIGHYTDICEDLNHSSLWLDISGRTHLRITQQSLAVANDLAFFPEPFFDAGDMLDQEIPFVYAAEPTRGQLQASAILASYFGKEAKWRGLQFPVMFNTLPEQHAVVFATLDSWPDFLRDHPMPDGPIVELITPPEHDYHQVLLVLGRNDAELREAATALAVGTSIFRGRSVTIEEMEEIAPRQPYDAPNWVPVDRPVSFSELLTYPDQLETSGLLPKPISLGFSLPPDLFVWRNSGVPLRLSYRYTEPRNNDDSRLSLHLNQRFIDSYRLQSSNEKGALTELRLPLRGMEVPFTEEKRLIPAIKVGQRNQLRFGFSFAAMVGAAQHDSCQTLLPPDVHAAIDDHSTLDFSGFPHYIAMPNLSAFAQGGYPFSRMADLSDTIAVMPSAPSAIQTATFLETMAGMGAQIGYPSLRLRVMNDWEAASQEDADILLIGHLPHAMKARPDGNLLLDDTRTTLQQPRVSTAGKAQTGADRGMPDENRQASVSKVSVRSVAPMAAVVGMQSEHFPERSIVGLLASTDEDFALLREALASTGKRDVMEGSVVLIRESGVSAERVGPVYYVGHIAWWEKVWYFLAERALLMAGATVLLILLITVFIWKLLRKRAHRRLRHES